MGKNIDEQFEVLIEKADGIRSGSLPPEAILDVVLLINDIYNSPEYAELVSNINMVRIAGLAMASISAFLSSRYLLPLPDSLSGEVIEDINAEGTQNILMACLYAYRSGLMTGMLSSGKFGSLDDLRKELDAGAEE